MPDTIRTLIFMVPDQGRPTIRVVETTYKMGGSKRHQVVPEQRTLDRDDWTTPECIMASKVQEAIYQCRVQEVGEFLRDVDEVVKEWNEVTHESA